MTLNSLGGSQQRNYSIAAIFPIRGHTVNENIVVMELYRIDICPQHAFTAHSVYEPNFHTRQFNVCRQQINALAVAQNTVAIRNRDIVNHVLHNICKRNGQFVRLGVTEGKRQRSLRVRVDQQNPFVFLRQPDTEICGRRGFAHASPFRFVTAITLQFAI